MPVGEITEPEAERILAKTRCTVQIYTRNRTQARELKIYGSPFMVSVGYGETMCMMFERLVQQDDQEQEKVADKICEKYWKSCFNPKYDGTHTKTTLAIATTARAMKAIATTARASADDAPTPMTTARSSKDDEPQAKAMPKKEKQHETDEGGNTQPPSKKRRVINMLHETTKAITAEDEQSSLKHEFATPRASTSAQGPGPSLAVESPLIITPNPGGQKMATQILPVPTSPPRSFGPVPIFPFQPTKEPGPPTNGESMISILRALKAPLALENVIEEKKEEDAFRRQ